MFLEINRNIDPIVKLCGDWLSEINVFSIIIRLLFAILFAGIIGVERATKNHAAGFRTYILVCLGATIAMMTNQFMMEYFESGDSARLGAQVISGIGFLGAGTIIVTSRRQITGLTTAAGLWACACVGLAIGIGFYTLALISSIFILLALTIFMKFEEHFRRKSRIFEIHLELDSRIHLKDFTAYVRENQLKVNSLEHNPAYSSSGLSVYTISLEYLDKKASFSHPDFIEEIKKLEYVNYAEEIF